VPRIFPVVRRVVRRAGGPGAHVEAHRLTYDLPELAPAPLDEGGLQLLAAFAEVAPGAGDAIAVVVAVVPDVAPAALDADAVVRAAVAELAPAPHDEVAVVVAVVPELAPLPADSEALVVASAELSPVALDDFDAVVRAAVAELAPAAHDEVAVVVAVVPELAPEPTDASVVVAAAAEPSPVALDDADAVVRAAVAELAPAPHDEVAVVVAVVPELAPEPPIEEAIGRPLVVTGANAFVEDVGVATNPALALGRVDGFLASIADTSATSAQNKTLRLLYPDFDATVQSFAIAAVWLIDHSKYERGTTAAGVAMEYRLGPTADWVALRTRTFTPWDDLAGGRIWDLSTAVAGSWAAVNGLEVRFVLTDTSLLAAGTGKVTIDAVELRVDTVERPL
jgi:hypothetical protein